MTASADSQTRSAYYHGTDIESAEAIADSGFRTWNESFDDHFNSWFRWPSGGNLGNGIYVTSQWDVALFFGDVLLRVELERGTRTVDLAVPPDRSVITQLSRKFGTQVLTRPPRQVLPRNKRLTTGELIELARYHYERAWGRDHRILSARGRETAHQHATMIQQLRNDFVRHGIDGVGEASTGNGLVIFAGERVVLREVVAQVRGSAREALDEHHLHDTPLNLELDDVERRFWSEPGFGRARQLAARVRRQQGSSRS